MTITGVIDETKRFLEHYTRQVWLAAKFWDNIVTASTFSKLTSPTDRLPSLAGLAQQFGEGMAFLPPDYLAGLWMPFLPTSLLWTLEDGNCDSIAERLESSRSPESHVAASWSPLSLYGATTIGFMHEISLCGHIRTECGPIKGTATASGSNWYATSTGARLTVMAARTVQTSLDPRSLSSAFKARRVTKNDRYAAYCFLDFEDTDPPALGKDILLLLLCSSCSGGSADLHDWGDGTKLDDEHGSDDDVALTEDLRRVKSEYSKYDTENLIYEIPTMEKCLLCQTSGLSRRAWGLVLHPAGEENVFFRIGMFMSRAREAGGTVLFSGSQVRTLEII